MLARSPTRGAAARCAHRPQPPEPGSAQAAQGHPAQRVAGHALMSTYLPGAQAQGGHLGAVVEFQMASHDCCKLHTTTRKSAALAPARTFK